MGVPDVDWLADRISADMLDQWRRFEVSFGPLLIHERLDMLFAAVLARGSGKPVKDFLPHWGESYADDIVGRLNALASREKG